MSTPTHDLTIESLVAYSPKDAATIGKLLSHLSESFSGDPVPEQTLTDIIESPYHEQLVARDELGSIVGTATVSVTFGAGVGCNAWLEDFVVNPEIQGMGIGSRLWDAIIDWCREKNVQKLGFTSRASRTAAQAFYLKHGAVIRDTNYFKKDIQNQVSPKGSLI